MCFVSDVAGIMRKYRLYDVLETYVTGGNFPSKAEWKRLINCKMKEHNYLCWQNRVTADETFSRFLLVQNNCHEFSVIWLAAKHFKLDRHKFAFLAKLLIIPPMHSGILCVFCGLMVIDIVEHYVLTCGTQVHRRHMFWTMVEEIIGSDKVQSLQNLEARKRVAVVLGASPTVFGIECTDTDHLEIIKTSALTWYMPSTEHQRQFLNALY